MYITKKKRLKEDLAILKEKMKKYGENE